MARHRTALFASVGAGAALLLSACEAVPGNLRDTSPPSITFTYGSTVVPNGTTKLVNSAKQLLIKGKDSGGMESIETAIVSHVTCTRLGVHAHLSDTNPQSLKGYEYFMPDQVYYAHRTTPDGFWPDANNNGINDPSEHHLRYNELWIVDSKELVGQSFAANSLGEDCVMPSGKTGTITDSYLEVTATARNTRSEIASAPLSQKQRKASIFLRMNT